MVQFVPCWIRSIVLSALLALGAPSEGFAQGPYGMPLFPTTLTANAISTPNVPVTLTIPAANGFHYITVLQVTRSCTVAIIGSSVLAITTGNLPGSLAMSMGDACVVGSTNRDVDLHPVWPIKSTLANTDTTITCPALGLTGVCRIMVIYGVLSY